MKLSGAVVVITGASRGLGKCLANELKAQGAKVVVGDLESEDLRTTLAELEAPGLHCDVTERAHVEALAQEAIKHYGRIDIWINNAGIWMPYGPVEELDFKRARALMEVNYFGLAHGTVEALKHMRKKGQGVIVNMISVRGLEGKGLAAGYSASKFAAEGFTQAVRAEVAGSGVSVIGIYPYRMKTGLFGENKHADYDSSMEPEEVATIIIENLKEADPAEHVEIWGQDDIRAKHIHPTPIDQKEK
ncbi:MAG: short-chain dehydrogenase/reductase [Parcubacteria group bacterium Gr01-1014_56]|nr:MAG: short-chain dehydrogenase/reductase [Parcubacteria group bacterium Gr01-1014_56]